MKAHKKNILTLFICLILASGVASAVSAVSYVMSTPFPCGVCLGVGKVKDNFGRWQICRACDGSGNQPENKEEGLKPTKFPEAQCKPCKGKGGWNTSYGWVKCENCEGSGKEKKRNR